MDNPAPCSFTAGDADLGQGLPLGSAGWPSSGRCYSYLWRFHQSKDCTTKRIYVLRAAPGCLLPASLLSLVIIPLLAVPCRSEAPRLVRNALPSAGILLASACCLSPPIEQSLTMPSTDVSQQPLPEPTAAVDAPHTGLQPTKCTSLIIAVHHLLIPNVPRHSCDGCLQHLRVGPAHAHHPVPFSHPSIRDCCCALTCTYCPARFR